MDIFYQIALTLIPGIGDITIKNLLSFYSTPEDIFRETTLGLKTFFGNRKEIILAIRERSMFKRVEEELSFIQKYNVKTFFYTDNDFPYRLKRGECVDSPVLLYYKGNADLNTSKVISIIGTRNATSYGEAVVKDILQSLANENILIVSGLAYGIDTFAHKYALSNDLHTVGVVAHGLHKIYPAQNKNLAKEMIKNGGIITEFRSDMEPCPGIFPKRNRIIAGLSDAVIVVEAAKKGGALITAEIANSYNREVFAVPGNLKEIRSEGCNYLIRANKANLLQTTDDIRYILGWNKKTNSKTVQQKIFIDLDPNELKVYKTIEKEKICGIDEISILCELPQMEVSCILLNLELNGVIKCLPGKVYRIQ